MFARNKVFAVASFKIMQDLIFLSRTSNFIDDEEFFALSDLFEWKNTCFACEDYSTFNLNEMTESECLSEIWKKRHSHSLSKDI